MGSLWATLKKGNMSSATAALGNTGLAIVKGLAAAYSGSGAMFASAMHSVADAVNQGFVFFGSVLAEKKPTPRFPTGFGRVINLFCMIAVIVVTVMAYETIMEGLHLIKEPAHASHFWVNFWILLLAIVVDGYVLVKAMKEIVHETRVDAKGWAIIPAAFRNVGRAAPPTRLVFYEDIVATTGALLALIAVIVTQFSSFALLDGIATMLIGVLMIGVAFKVGYDNMVGLIGVAAPKEIEDRVAKIIFADPDVTDINRLRIVQEGRFYHVECYVELRPGLTLAVADDIKYRIRDSILTDPDISDVTMGILEDNGARDWEQSKIVEGT
ncbi:cation diffusion facilitator family transporter [Brevibacillus choshinensis]|uniref:cation diffusion facilitator family transporter n=1 Tax=Brevibacillus choshinensis TaxID=54911 RepID=UPI002E1C0785|nr:cation diffusion facilitator family transporter [Brevibacillus choshinensis]MED4752612.1 cation diffusion facilitator family transporter [Brevibacillus choshinensis]MED4782788.1 cation diffusion facilitator family transporter [Brevibacillus choshinensis]